MNTFAVFGSPTHGTFERVICYDVFTNFPDFESVAKVLRAVRYAMSACTQVIMCA